MSNPVFSNSPVFGDPNDRRNRARAQAGAGNGAMATQTIDAVTLDKMYEAPSATARDTGRLTYDDVIIKTAGLFALLVVSAAVAWTLVPGLWVVGAVVGLVLGLVNAFKREPSPVLISLYAVAQGVFLGGISLYFEQRWPGLVVQAVLATFAVFAASLFLFRSGRVRVTPKFTRWLIVALVGYLVFSLVNVVLMVFNVGGGEFGPLRSGPLGIVVGLVAVGLAAASLIVDFDSIKRGVDMGAPRKLAWSAAFGLVVTLVWLYLEMLRLLAILRGD
ncbi:Bax inhibitor-1/YccA family protein [Cellulomonas sp. H30R-01]|uniref:Bax inhibitor-1/YccA family protein n=1 Tax=Cellulomonas sp. H30R-01 TaxID=2704467 RepID=UPI00138B681E|nr:Bax inhibitor-1/YccA family protein [Cellulomonas sp. H30R-01]QHT54814.1 Bax inhibitor-1/YccA family protein [Cellulomonas sp. H30R-01]